MKHEKSLRLTQPKKRSYSRIKNYFRHINSKKPGFTIDALPSLKPFIKYPKRGINYTKGEMRYSIIFHIFFIIYLIFLLTSFTFAYFSSSIFSSLLMIILLGANILNIMPKLMILNSFLKISLLGNSKIQNNQRRYFRAEIIKIFGKRIYHTSVHVNGITMLLHLLIFVVSMKFFLKKIFFKKQNIFDLRRNIDLDLFVYCSVYFLRFLYSWKRYKKYFQEFDKSLNIFCLEEEEINFEFGKILEGTECPICCGEFKEGENVARLECDCKYYYHFGCVNEWIEKRNQCLLCRKRVLE